MAKAKRAKLTVMVSSSVLYKEPMLDQIYAALSGFGYKVWMSYRGTVPIIPGKSAFESCIIAVERCDIFFGIITPNYGSGVIPGALSITHGELLKAIEGAGLAGAGGRYPFSKISTAVIADIFGHGVQSGGRNRPICPYIPSN